MVVRFSFRDRDREIQFQGQGNGSTFQALHFGGIAFEALGAQQG